MTRLPFRRTIAALLSLLCVPLIASAEPSPASSRTPVAPRRDPKTGVTVYSLYDGSTATLDPDGIGWKTDARGLRARPFTVLRPRVRTGLRDAPGARDAEIQKQLSLPPRSPLSGSDVIVVLDGVVATGGPLPAVAAEGSATDAPAATSSAPSPGASPTLEPLTSDDRVNAAFAAVGAASIRPLFGAAPKAELVRLSGAGARSLAASAPLDLSSVYLLRVRGVDPARAARALAATPGVAYASPDFPVASFAVDPRPLPDWLARRAHDGAPLDGGSAPASRALASAGGSAADVDPLALPANYGLQSSLQSYLNATGVDAAGAFRRIAERFGQLPGQGTIVTNVSIGDLTDQSMADAGDFYVQIYGPTTTIVAGQRYLDFPALPLIPAWSTDASGALDPRGPVEFVDPFLSEVLLDFSVMAPLPHDRQRAENPGNGLSDLLGIAPGAQYRLVVPKAPTISNILAAMLAAARQTPKPDVINASLGFGFDSVGFPGRYLEDDPLARSVVSSIVNQYGIVVTIAVDDGLRLFTPAAVGPDGGSAPTDLLPAGGTPTSVADDSFSTAPSLVPDSGAIAVGGSTLDDVFSASPQSGDALAAAGSFPETRINGATTFSSGFGSRVNVCAPSDNIASLVHVCSTFPCTNTQAIVVLGGGTSASAPMTAAAAAVAIQVARLTGSALTPSQVRDLLVTTGRALPNPPQIDRPLQVGPQIDVTKAVETLLARAPSGPPAAGPVIVRLGVAHRQPLGGLGAVFTEATDPAAIDLNGPYDFIGNGLGQNLTGPITFAPDIVGLTSEAGISYAVRVGGKRFGSSSRSIRILPSDILAAARLPLVSTVARSVAIVYEVRGGNQVIASAPATLTFGPSDGTYAEALAPVVAPVTAPGQSVTVRYDLANVRGVDHPALLVSSIGHWSPVAAPNFRAVATIPLTRTTGSVTVPASAFSAGGGIYGVGVQQNATDGTIGEFAALRIEGPAFATRPASPTLASGAGGAASHLLHVTRAAPAFTVAWNAAASGAGLAPPQGSGVPTGAVLEISAPGPTLYSSLQTFTNGNGDRRDMNGTDAGSTIYRTLPGVSGSAVFDAAALGLATSLFYSVRVLPTKAGAVAGQASASSALFFDDGMTPGAAAINDFDIVPGGASAVATSLFDAGGNLVDSAIFPYTPATGAYGAPVADDSTGLSVYTLLGSDPALHALAALNLPWFGTKQYVQTYDTVTGHRTKSVRIDGASDLFLLAGRVDQTRHRAALLGWDAFDASDNVVSFDLDRGRLGSRVFADVGTDNRGFFTVLDADRSSGRIYLANALFGDLCMFRGGGFTGVDLDAGTASPVSEITACSSGLASDQSGGNAYVSVGPEFAFPRLFPVARYQAIDEATQVTSDLQDLGARSPLFPVVDPVNHLLLVAFLAEDDYLENNNAMSAVGVYDTRTGSRVALIPSFNFLNTAFGNDLIVAAERGIQIDPATRRGWTYGPYGVQVQEFRY